MASLAPRNGILGPRLAAHLLRRATFGPTISEINAFAGMTAVQAVDALVSNPPLPDYPIDPLTGQTWVINGSNGGSPDSDKFQFTIAWWLRHILDAPTPSLLYKMIFFLHTRFSTDMLVPKTESHYYTLRLFWQYALGSYKTVARAICTDNAMLDYLDIHLSTKWSPNENFARELLELFTIGKGPQVGPDDYTNYTEYDIKQAARIMTGFKFNHNWSDPTGHDPVTGLPRANVDTSVHDSGDKVFSAAFAYRTIVGGGSAEDARREADELIDMVFDQPATALHICRKLYQFFVHFDITQEVEEDIITPLASTLMNNNYELSFVLQELLCSEHFYDEGGTIPEEYNVAALIKSPLELVLGTLRMFKVTLPDPQADPMNYYRDLLRNTVQIFLLPEAGMVLYQPPSVAGYPAYHQEPDFSRQWISANTLPFRYTLADMLLTGQKITIPGSLHMQLDAMALVTDTDIVPSLTAADPYNGVVGTYAGGRFAAHLVHALVDYALPEPISPDRFSYFLNDLLLGNFSEITWRMEWVAYEESGDDSNIRPQIEQLIRGILQAPEYQLG